MEFILFTKMRVHIIELVFVWLAYGILVSADLTPSTEQSTPSVDVTSIKKLNIAIYYESLCPDSIDFMTNQLAPSYDLFKSYINILFVPFGKAESENNGRNFYCQHGPAECTGNRMQSCVLDALADDQDAKVKFVTCQMDWNAEYTGQNCASLVNVSYADTMACTNGARGVELQLNDEKRTHKIAKPYPSYIPTIVFEERFGRQNQWRSLKQFKSLVCEKLAPALKTSNGLSQACA